MGQSKGRADISYDTDDGMNKEDITPENLIAINRMDLFVRKTLDALEKKDPEMKKRIKAIKSRAKINMIEISKEAKEEFSIKSAQMIMELLVKCIKVMDLKERKVRITKEILEQADKL